MNIFELLELDASASGQEIDDRAIEKQRYFANLAQAAPTKMLSELYTRRLAEIDRFLEERGLSANSKRAAEEELRSASKRSGEQANNEFFLIDADPARKSRAISLQPGLNIVGRQPRNMGTPVILNDDYVSTNHAVVEIVPGPPTTVHVYDVGEISSKPSTNGVFVNGSSNRIKGRVALTNGDRIRFGQSNFVLQCNVRQAAPRPARVIHDDESDKTVIIKAPFR